MLFMELNRLCIDFNEILYDTYDIDDAMKFVDKFTNRRDPKTTVIY